MKNHSRILGMVLLCAGLVTVCEGVWGKEASPVNKKKQTMALSASEQSPGSSTSVSVPPEYKIQSKDRLEIIVYPDETLTRIVEVNSKGFISMPLIGKLEIGGKTIYEAEDQIADLLRQDYLVDPVVSIKISQYHEKSCVVVGEVKSPGTYVLDPGGSSTLMRVIASAGGFTDLASTGGIKIIRMVEGNETTIPVNAKSIISGNTPDLPILPDDLVIVPESFF